MELPDSAVPFGGTAFDECSVLKLVDHMADAGSFHFEVFR